MTGPKGNREFCFSEILIFHKAMGVSKAKGIIEGQGETKLAVCCGTSH